MKDILKQRLVGALILVALGVVFWPIIFVEQDRRPDNERAAIPPRPAVETSAIERPSLDGLRPSQELRSRREAEDEQSEPADLPAPLPEPATAGAVAGNDSGIPADPGSARQTPAAAVAAAGSQAKKTRSEAPVSPEIDDEGVPVAWILQVVTVSSADKAEQLRVQLLELDQKAYVKRVRRGDSDLYRVYIGPKFERARLEALKPEIDARFRVSSLVVRYLP